MYRINFVYCNLLVSCLNIVFLLISFCYLCIGSKELLDKDEIGSIFKSKMEDEEVYMLLRKRKGLRLKTEFVF